MLGLLNVSFETLLAYVVPRGTTKATRIMAETAQVRKNPWATFIFAARIPSP
jgi:hypothetical protein